MDTNFQYAIVPADRWSRLPGTTARGGNEPRPHLIPTTDWGRRRPALPPPVTVVTVPCSEALYL
jgi:hypothetical protein